MQANSDVIIIPVLSHPLNLETAERKKKILRKIKYLENEKSFLDGNEKHFS